RLQQSGPTVSQTAARLERGGLLHVRPHRRLDLTPEAREHATSVMRKHRPAERLLTDALGLDLIQVRAAACRWEHDMSEDVERRVVAVIDDPSLSPFGNPIPGLEKLGAVSAPFNDDKRAIDLPHGEEVEATITQINEIIQYDGNAFKILFDAGMNVGTDVTVRQEGGVVTLTNAEGGTVQLADDYAHAIRVALR